MGTTDPIDRMAPVSALREPNASSIVDTLLTRSSGRHDVETIRRLVTRFIAEFEDVPVKDFIAVLVAKRAMDELRAMDRQTHHTF